MSAPKFIVALILEATNPDLPSRLMFMRQRGGFYRRKSEAAPAPRRAA